MYQSAKVEVQPLLPDIVPGVAAGSQTQSEKKPFRSDINALRALAICAVVLYHSDPSTFAGGQMGVDIFLLISGFVAAQSVANIENLQQFSPAASMLMRLTRIVPTYAAMALVTYAASWYYFTADSFTEMCHSLAASTVFMTNWYYFKTTNYFSADSQLLPLQHLWYLSLDMQLHVCWIVVKFLLSFCRLPTKPFLRVLCSCAAIESYLFFIRELNSDPTGAFYLPHFRAWEYCLGLCLGLCEWPSTALLDGQPNPCSQSLWPRIRENLFQPAAGQLVGLAAICSAMYSRSAHESLDTHLLLIVLGGTGLILLCQGHSGPVMYLFDLRLIQWIGTLSYAIYLWHWPAFAIRHYMHAAKTTAAGQLGLVAPTVMVSFLSHRYIEIPCRSVKLGHTVNAKFTHAFRLVCVLSSLLVVGLIGSQKGSFGKLQYTARNYSDETAFNVSAIELSQAYGQMSKGWPYQCQLALALQDETSDVESLFNDDECTFGKNDTTLQNVILLGDSHAGHLEGTVRYLATMLGFRGRLIAIVHYLPFPESIQQHRESESIQRSIKRMRKRVLTFLNSQPPSVIILNAYWKHYIVGHRIFGDDKKPDSFFVQNGTDTNLTESHSLQVFERALENGLGQILSLGHVIILIGPGPEFDFDPKLAWNGSPKRVMPSVGRARLDAYLDDTRNALLRVASLSERMAYVDVMETSCNESHCLAGVDGCLWFRDRHHYSRDGSWSMGKALLPVIGPIFERLRALL